MARHTDERFLIDTDELLEKTRLKQMSTLRTYVGSYKIFVPVASAPNDKRRYLYDRRCVEIRQELLKLFVPRSGVSMKEFCECVNNVCGGRDERLLGELSGGASQGRLTEEKEQELLELLDEKKQQAIPGD